MIQAPPHPPAAGSVIPIIIMLTSMECTSALHARRVRRASNGSCLLKLSDVPACTGSLVPPAINHIINMCLMVFFTWHINFPPRADTSPDTHPSTQSPSHPRTSNEERRNFGLHHLEVVELDVGFARGV